MGDGHFTSDFMEDVDIDSLSMEDALARAKLASELSHDGSARSILAQTRRRYPHAARPAYLYGCALLEAGDPDGLEHLKHAMAQDESATDAVCARAIIFLHGSDDVEALLGFRKKQAAWRNAADYVQDASDRIGPEDCLTPLPLAQIRSLAQVLDPLQGRLSYAYAVRKQLPEWYEIAPRWLVVRQRGGVDLSRQSRVEADIKALLPCCDFEAPRVHVVKHDDARFLDVLRRVENACLWDRLVVPSIVDLRRARG